MNYIKNHKYVKQHCTNLSICILHICIIILKNNKKIYNNMSLSL